MYYKKQSSLLKQNLILLKDYYHIKSDKDLINSLIQDLMVTIFLRSGSGLFLSLFKGLISKFFIKSNFPVLIGRRFKVIKPSNIIFGHHVWIRDDVTLTAHGKINIGNDCVIGEKSEIHSHGKGIAIGSGSGVGKNCYIAQLGGPIFIGENVLIADSVRMYTLTHNYKDKKTIIMKQGYISTSIIIEDNVWIGSGAIILNNVTIGKGSVVGANSVVTKNVPRNSVIAGNPGKIIKKIDR